MNISVHPFLANLEGPQTLVILCVLILLFGAKKLPELAKGLGQAIREFSKAKDDISDDITREAPLPLETPNVEKTSGDSYAHNSSSSKSA
jgi:sec-independent protein translocase protein TatA